MDHIPLCDVFNRVVTIEPIQDRDDVLRFHSIANVSHERRAERAYAPWLGSVRHLFGIISRVRAQSEYPMALQNSTADSFLHSTSTTSLFSFDQTVLNRIVIARLPMPCLRRPLATKSCRVFALNPTIHPLSQLGNPHRVAVPFVAKELMVPFGQQIQVTCCGNAMVHLLHTERQIYSLYKPSTTDRACLYKTLHSFMRRSHNFNPPSPSAPSRAPVRFGLCRLHKMPQGPSAELRIPGLPWGPVGRYIEMSFFVSS